MIFFALFLSAFLQAETVFTHSGFDVNGRMVTIWEPKVEMNGKIYNLANFHNSPSLCAKFGYSLGQLNNSSVSSLINLKIKEDDLVVDSYKNINGELSLEIVDTSEVKEKIGALICYHGSEHPVSKNYLEIKENDDLATVTIVEPYFYVKGEKQNFRGLDNLNYKFLCQHFGFSDVQSFETLLKPRPGESASKYSVLSIYASWFNNNSQFSLLNNQGYTFHKLKTLTCLK